MRHRVRGRHLGRTAEHRRALRRNLVTALFEHGRIRTTDAKAREVRPLAEKLITLGKRGDLHARRLAVRVVGSGSALDRLFGPIAQRFASRPGGYTRIIKAGRRHGDAAPIAYLELLEEAPRIVRAPGAGEDDEDEAPRGRTRGGRGEGGDAAAGKGRGPKAARGPEADRPAKRGKAGSEEPARGGKRGKGKGGTPGTGAETARGSSGKGAAGGKPARGGGGGKEATAGQEGEGRGKAGRSR